MLLGLKRGIFLILPAGMILTTALGASRECPGTEAAKWAQEHRAHLPTSVAEMSRLGRPVQNAVFWRLSPQQRVSLMQEHLRPYLSSASGLTAGRRALLQEYYDAAPQLFKHDPEDVKDIMTQPGGFVERAKAAFGDSLMREIFVSIAPSPGAVVAKYNQAGPFAGMNQAIDSGLRALFGDTDCDCGVGIGCPLNYQCIWGPNLCKENWCYLIFWCDGGCLWAVT